LLPRLQAHWQATAGAVRTLDDELTRSLSATVDEALAALKRRPLVERIRKQMARRPAAPKVRGSSSRAR
jgi:hypothetical protein